MTDCPKHYSDSVNNIPASTTPCPGSVREVSVSPGYSQSVRNMPFFTSSLCSAISFRARP